MSTLETLWSACWPTLAIFFALGAMLFVSLIVSLRYAIRTDPERMSAEDAGVNSQSTPPLSTPTWPASHFVVVCCQCHHVKASAGRPVRIGDTLRVSHGLCPRCAKHEREQLLAHPQLTAA